MDNNNISLSELKKQIAINSNTNSPDLEIELCYSKRIVLVKPLKVRDKKELLKSLEGKNEILINKVLDDIIENYVVPADNQELNTNKLTIQERHQILVYIRAANGDEVAKIAHGCPKCEKVTRNIEYMISKDSTVVNYEEPADKKVILICNDEVELHYDVIFRDEEKEVEEYCKKNKLKTIADRQIAMIAATIKNIFFNVNGVKKSVILKDLSEKMAFIEDLDSKEFTKISNSLNSLDFGVKMPFDFKCEHCDYESKEEVNVTVFFIS